VPSGATHGFLWQGGQFTDLGTLGGRSAEATAINRHGQIVGASFAPKCTEWRAVIGLDGKVIDLDRLVPNVQGWRLWRAVAINNTGEIVASGEQLDMDAGSMPIPVHRSFLLTPERRHRSDAQRESTGNGRLARWSAGPV
jgi:hypothetical protein